MITKNSVFKIGLLGKPHGVKGEIQFRFIDDIFDRQQSNYLIINIDRILVPFFIEDYRFRSDNLALIKFYDINNLQQVSELIGREVFFPYSLSDFDNKGLTSFSQLINFTIINNSNNKDLGKIISIDDSTINSLFEIKNKEGKKYLLPANEKLIKNIDIKNQIIEMFIPNGILEL